MEISIEDRDYYGEEMKIRFRSFCECIHKVIKDGRLMDGKLKRLTVHYDVNRTNFGDAGYELLGDLSIIAEEVEEVAIGYLLNRDRIRNVKAYRVTRNAMPTVKKWAFPSQAMIMRMSSKMSKFQDLPAIFK